MQGKRFFLLFCSICLIVSAKQVSEKHFIKNDNESLYQLKDGRITGVIEQYTPVEILREEGEWAYVKIEGWVKKNSIRTEKIEPFSARNGFYYRNFSAEDDQQINGTRITGEMVNTNKKEYNIASFTLSVYDKDDKLLRVETIILNGFKPFGSQPFVERIRNIPYHRLNYYEIRFKMASEVDKDKSEEK